MAQVKHHLPTAVTGASGGQGGATARALLRADEPVRALTRNPAALDELRDLGAEVVYADLGDPASVRTALAGTRALFAVTTPFGTNADTETRQGIALLDTAAVTPGLDHVVFTSAINADRATGIPHFDSKYVIEEHLRSLGLPWTVIAPAVFMDNYTSARALQSLREGKLRLPLPAGTPLPLISNADVGAFAALALRRPAEFTGRRIDIAADELTPAQIAAAITTAVGAPIEFEEVPLAETYSADVAAMFRHFAEVGLDIDIAGLRRDYPHVGWQRFADWSARQQWDLR
jgi:uncharacterized protein YbjT (DUF2867 family)